MELIIDRDKLHSTLSQVAGKMAFAIQREVVARIPRRFRNRITVAESGGNWVIGTNDEIFKYWEKDTRPHVIRPKGNYPLGFKWPNAPAGLPSLEKYHFRKVNHPGTKGHEIFESIADDSLLMERILQEALQ